MHSETVVSRHFDSDLISCTLIADRTVWRFYDGFRNPIEELYLARDPLDILEERFLQMLLRLRVNAPNHFQRHLDRVIRDFHGAHMHKAG